MMNRDIAHVLYEFAGFLDMAGIEFKPRAYEKAARAIEALDENVEDIFKKDGVRGLEKISGVGKGIAARIHEYLETGTIKELAALKKKIPVDYEELSRIEGVGPKMIKKLYQELKIKTINDLDRAARKGLIARIGGFGKKSEENIIRHIEFVKKFSGRFTLGTILPITQELEARLTGVAGVKRVVIAGSVRRRKETIGDIDIIVVAVSPKKVVDFFVAMPEVLDVHAYGNTKGSVMLKGGINVDLRVVAKESFGAALNYFTGSKEHNVALRGLARKKGYKLNEYGLYKGKKRIAGSSEEELYRVLGIKQYIEPELREMTGEIEAAQRGILPNLIGYGDVMGDLQVQTNWTDGAHSIEDMANAAQQYGLSYILITDHTKSLAMTGGHDDTGLLKQWAYIDKLNKSKKFKVRILKGAEVNILNDGSLDISDSVLAKADIIGAAVHTNFNMTKKDMTSRIVRAMQNPHMDILFHPTGRILNRREAYELDMAVVIRTANKTGTILEIDASPDRLDLKDIHIREAVEAGVKMSIDTDTHNKQHYYFLEYGVAQARRGWATKNDIINAWPLEKMLKFLKDAR